MHQATLTHFGLNEMAEILQKQFQLHFMTEQICIVIKGWQNIVLKGLIEQRLWLVQVPSGKKRLYEIWFYDATSITGPQWKWIHS